MKKIVLENRVIYRADKGKKLKIKGNDELHSEIVFKVEHDNLVEEVVYGN